MKIAIVGIRGIPNNYGGFETLTEYLVNNLAKDFEITVYCSSNDIVTRLPEYNGAKLRYIPVSSHGFSGIIYDSVALIHALLNNDKVLFLGFGGGLIMPFLKRYREKLIVNIGGLDWKRSKWSKSEQMVIKLAEKNLIKYSATVIADNVGMQQYLDKEYHKKSIFIAYGGDQAKRLPINEIFSAKYSFLKSEYAFTVTRIQPDNNIEMMFNAFIKAQKLPLVIVGNWTNSAYGAIIKNKYSKQKNIILLDAIYDRNVLDVLRSNCKVYIHGHSAGGTNPSLVEAMYVGLPVFAYTSEFNEYTTEGKAIYFKDEVDLVEKIKNMENYPLKEISNELKKIAYNKYTWEIVSNQYKKVFLS